jgi:hypothetical protein
MFTTKTRRHKERSDVRLLFFVPLRLCGEKTQSGFSTNESSTVTACLPQRHKGTKKKRCASAVLVPLCLCGDFSTNNGRHKGRHKEKAMCVCCSLCLRVFVVKNAVGIFEQMKAQP